MSADDKVPDAWDDDWVSRADVASTPSTETADKEVKVSKRERRAKQAELNKQLWDEAEAPETPYFVETRNHIPIKSDLKPAVKVLSRKPAPQVISRRDPVTGLEQLTIDEEEDDEDEESAVKPLTMEERQLKALKEREEKQRKYEEVRQRLFGTTEGVSSSGLKSPDDITPPTARPGFDKDRSKVKLVKENRPTPPTGRGRQLFDPNYTAKPDSDFVQRRDQLSNSGSSTPVEEYIIRNPKGPDSSGAKGFSFANRGGKAS